MSGIYNGVQGLLQIKHLADPVCTQLYAQSKPRDTGLCKRQQPHD